ncbi:MULTISPECIES: response regulator [Eubacterium]|uniref:Stage 0 sporulation protein A homolog n=2 Tax=Eubacterium ruminantium TaxID=42322 RepID=A0A1T4PCN6_9FIRM|nr:MULTISPECIES: response regulator [Eubacterium]MCR5368824.1 response regulator [Eubacterium sp.]SCW58066.1 two-component system, chemotaxis family, response regulator CheY [Eubacterium ruminantium]SDN00220.1 two-component system, chemotaxis family, response regulator CheY [Eubacterium ruminantium]SJZ89259.1 two-component system, chemotaxis family, response regulator CheY [Eubacterium ruminantium]
MKVLIAEDDMASGKFLMKLLSKYGHVDLARDGIEAVDNFVKAASSEEKYDLVCLDIMMPKIDGYKALESIRNAERKLGIPRISRCKIIMISALDEGFDSSYASDDYDEYICKPIDIVKFDNIIKKMGLFD